MRRHLASKLFFETWAGNCPLQSTVTRRPLSASLVVKASLGKIRHLDVTDLWIQEKFNNKLAFLHKVLGSENPADLLTKYTDRSVLDMALKKAGLAFMDGRSAVAPAAMGTSQASSHSVPSIVPPGTTTPKPKKKGKR